jgi:hypothetical protein
VHLDVLNVQDQKRMVWPASFSVARAYLDQLNRKGGISSGAAKNFARDLDRAEKMSGQQQRDALTKLASDIESSASGAGDSARVRAMAGAVRDIVIAAR